MNDDVKNAVENILSQGMKRNTRFVKLDPCAECGCDWYYTRKGRAHNGCVYCRQKERQKEMESAVAVMVDENGVKLTLGKRACSKCGTKIKLGENAYGAKEGRCRECAIAEYVKRENTKLVYRLETRVNKGTHDFLVRSIERSQTVLVAPRTQQEFYAMKDLMMQCQLMNERNKKLDVDVIWEIGHRYPAYAAGELRGKATVENCYLIERSRNRQEGNTLPDVWLDEWVVSVGDAARIKTSYEAAKAWKDQKAKWIKKLDAKEKQARDEREKRQYESHQKAVAALSGDVLERFEEFLAEWKMPTFEEMWEEVKDKWERNALRMTLAIDGFTDGGVDVKHAPYEALNAKLKIDAFMGADARLWIVTNTFDQLADAEMILDEMGGVDDALLERVKIDAVLWAKEVLGNPMLEVMGFTSPVLDVLGDWRVWGTERNPADGVSYISAWKNLTLQGQSTPFENAPDLDLVNKKLKGLTPYSYFTTLEKAADLSIWKNNDADDLGYVRLKEKARIAAEKKRQEEEKAAKVAAELRAMARFEKEKADFAVEMEKKIDKLVEYLGHVTDEWPRRIGTDYVNAAYQALEECRPVLAMVETESDLRSLDSATKTFGYDLNWGTMQSVMLDPFKHSRWWMKGGAMAAHLAKHC